jgi:hypothetical protein
MQEQNGMKSKRWYHKHIVPRQTLLVQSRRSRSTAMGVRCTSGMDAVSLAFKRRMPDCFSVRFNLYQQRHDVLYTNAEGSRRYWRNGLSGHETRKRER